MSPELDVVALTVDLSNHLLKRGDPGTVVLVHDHGAEFEFVSAERMTLALLTLNPQQMTLAQPG